MDASHQNIFAKILHRIKYKVASYLRILYVFLVEPKSINEEKHRKELVCNILLLFTISLLTILDVLVFVNYISSTSAYIGIHPLIMSCITGSALCLLYFSRIGYTNMVSQGVIWLLITGGVYGQIIWGADLPSIILLWSFIITASSILISTKYSFYLSIYIGIGTIILQTLTSRGVLKPITTWKEHGFKIDDAIEYAVVFMLIAGVSWISNREIYKSLQKTKQAQLELEKERDTLEIKVIERTEQLHKAQVDKINSMYQLVEFGRISSGLFHDLMTPLNTLGIAIHQLKTNRTIKSNLLSKSNISDPDLHTHHREVLDDVLDIDTQLDRCIKTSKRITDFISLAKRQIQTTGDEVKFEVCTEIKNVIRVLESKARQRNTHIFFNCDKNINLYGSPTLFSHIMTNLISNAIDSYEGPNKESPIESSLSNTKYEKNKILIYCRKKKRYIEVRVKDFGTGIPAEVQPHIFETFFTTKSISGCGIGLSATKHTVEKNFKGTISFMSRVQNIDPTQNIQHGTVFTIKIPIIKHVSENVAQAINPNHTNQT